MEFASESLSPAPRALRIFLLCGPGVPLRSTPGSTLSPAPRVYHAADHDYLWKNGNAVLVGAISNIHAGYTGTGFVDYLNPSGDYIEWTVSVPTAGSYTLDFRYGNGGTTNRPLELRVNQALVNSSLPFLSTGTWTNWSLSSAPVSLNAGTNTIRLTAIGSSGRISIP